jgi:cation diffusion facilitator family transporter
MSSVPPPAGDTRPSRPRRLLAPRHSRAALRAAANRDSQRNILIALVANVAVAAAKLAAGLTTGSSALLAEAAHSAADSANEVLLGVSLRRSRRPADEAHPFGYGGTRFLWAFLAAIFSFLIGGCFSIALAIRELERSSSVDRFLIGWIVLAVAFLADGISLRASIVSTRREAARWGLSAVRFLQRTSDPTLRALVVEDTAALIGVGLAAAGLFLHQVLGWTNADAVASLLIGILLAATALGLAGPLADLLIGQSMQTERLEIARGIIAASPSIDEVLSAFGVHIGPQEVVVAAKVRPKPGLTSEQLARAFDDIDRALRERLREVAEVYLDPTSYSAERVTT